MEQRFVFWLKRVGRTAAIGNRFPDSSFGDWKLSLNAYNYNNRHSWKKAGFMVAPPLCHNPHGLTAVAIERYYVRRYVPYFYAANPAHLIGPLSIDDGWPQNARVELPQGLPSTPGTVNLPFRATLAPLPK